MADFITLRNGHGVAIANLSGPYTGSAIGKPKEKIRIEPVEDPVPSKTPAETPTPTETPAPTETPVEVPA